VTRPGEPLVLDGYVPWPDDVAARYRRKGYWEGVTLAERLDAWAARSGDQIALVGGGQRLSYRDLALRSSQLAAGLRGVGIGRGERVIVQLPNVPEFVTLCFALFRVGALPVLTLPAHREHEIVYLAQHSEAVAYAVPGTAQGFDYLELGRTVRAAVPSLKHLLVAGETDDPHAHSLSRLEQGFDDVAGDEGHDGPHPSDVALFLLSGGTTGLPKLIPRTHDDYGYNVRACAEASAFGAGTVYLATLPVAHNFPFGCPGMLGTFHAGGRVVMCPSPDPEVAFALIEQERVTATSLVPALAIRWLESPLRERFDLTSLRQIQVGGQKFNPEVAARVQPLLGARVQQVFGMAEGLINYTRLDDPDDVVLETGGRPVSPDDEIRIVDEDEQPVAAGEPGQLLTRGPYTPRGYFRAEAHNRAAYTPDGFYRTGDIVRMHPSGNLIVEGRVKDLINRGGEKISVEEVENLILAHPRVREVAVVAMPDPVLAERACAYVIPRDDATLTLGELTTFLAGRGVAKFKFPERLELVEAFPLTNVGKVSKKDLREDIARRLQTEG
jgi:2,3-dihydroxybenzoate-AMP ligase